MATPKPLIEPHVDLRDFHFMPLNIIELTNSETWAMADGWQSRALINLWCRAWHQVPAGSLPDNEDLLAKWADVSGHSDATGTGWEKVRGIALRGFITCSDGRLYHERLCEKVREAWQRKEEAADKREGDRQRKKRWRTRNDPQDQQPGHGGRDADVTMPSRVRQGQGQGQDRTKGKKESEKLSSKGSSPKANSSKNSGGEVRPPAGEPEPGSEPLAGVGTTKSLAEALGAKPPRSSRVDTDYSQPENRKARWRQKVFTEAKATMPDNDAEKFIVAYMGKVKWAIDKAEQLDFSMKAAKARGAVR